MEQRTPYYGASQFTYDPDQDCYRCSAGQSLHRHTIRYTEEEVFYQADAATCNTRPLKANCTASVRGRMVRRSFYAAYLDRVRGYHQTLPTRKRCGIGKSGLSHVLARRSNRMGMGWNAFD
jgi:hypothetical protein